jgi:indolepyruvate ferredoxin oxidoreductase
VTLDAIKDGIRHTIKADFKENLRAFDVGRKLVSHPELFWESEPAPSLARTVREKAAYLNMRLLGSRRALRNENPRAAGSNRLRDTELARSYKGLVYTALRACRELDRETMRAIAVRIYDLIQWGGVRYAKRYVDRVRRVFLTDLQRRDFAATRAVVWNLAHLMLIKDEFYVAHLLTSYEKLRRDRQRYNVNPANGDRIRYKRTFHPRFFGRQIDIRVPHWSLYLLRKFRFLRRVMPWYHTQDKQFLRWYEGVVDGFSFSDDATYDQYLEALRTVESVTGYAEIRWPKMEAARARAEQILAALRKSKSTRRGQVTV